MPRLPRKVAQRPGRPSAPKRQAKRWWMSPSATPATQNEGRCHQVIQVPRLPRETKVDVTKCHACHVTKCHACHAKWRGTLGDQARPSGRPSARPSAPPEPAQCRKCHACHVKDGGWQSCVSEMVCDKVVCERWCVTKVSGADGAGSRIQNQKQEPHTNMWGKKIQNQKNMP